MMPKKPMTLDRKKRIAIALFTANQWGADTQSSPLGIAMLSLGTTRTVHSEEHRRNCVNEIQANIATVIEWDRCNPESGEDYAKEVRRLADLWRLVNEAVVGEAWISDAENNRINEMLYQAGKL